jgi:tripartite-type tricarboxylate transporter receptor subunit TctC
MITRRKAIRIALGAGLSAALAPCARPAGAQDYPSKPIRLIVPTGPGGSTDQIGRLAADYITAKTGQTVVVENRAGAGGTLGLEAVARSAPDGYTLGACNAGDIVVTPFIYKHLSFNSFKDLVPIAMVGKAPELLVISGTLPFKTFQEFIAYAKANPGKISYASAGPGTFTQLGAERLARLAGLKLVHVPYRGAAAAVSDLITGRVQMMHVGLGPVQAQVQQGHLRVLVVTGPERWEHVPEVPTSAEAGLPAYQEEIWFGIVAPRGTPAPIVAQLNGYMRAMVAEPDLSKRIRDGALNPVSMSATEFQTFIDREAPVFEQLVHDIGVTLD